MIAEDKRKGKVSLTLHLCLSITIRLLERESGVEVWTSSPIINKLSVAENRGCRSSDSSFILSEL